MIKAGLRRFLYLATIATALSSAASIARSQTYPTKPVRMIVGFAAGGVTDTVARLMSQKLSDRLGQQFLVENRTGAGTNIATESVANAPPDGYTFLLATSANAINATLYEKLNFNFVRDLAPVTGIVDSPLAMVVNPTFPARSVSEFIAHAKANPGKINMASAGFGSPSHVTGELFKMIAGVNLTHVPYRGSAPANADLIAGQVQVLFGDVTSSIEYVRAGQLRALAAMTTKPLDVLPEIPTIADFLPGFEASSWQGLCAPKNTPASIIDKLNGEINAILADQKVKAQVKDLGLRVLSGPPADFRKLIDKDTEKWAKAIKFAGIKAD
jgi:tripartite-type tricarboxylate transporter receptor subunit TctC